MYIVRKIFNISSGLTCGCCLGFALPRRRDGLGDGAAFKIGECAAAGFGSAFATDFEVKAPSGRPSDFLTSLRTLVSLMIAVASEARPSGRARYESGPPEGRASDTRRLRRRKFRFQNITVLLRHSRMSVRRCRLNSTLQRLAGFGCLVSSLVTTGQHAVRVSFIVSAREITLERLNHLLVVPTLLVFLREAKEHHGVRRITGEHLFENLDA